MRIVLKKKRFMAVELGFSLIQLGFVLALIKKEKQPHNDSAGDRTQNLWFRRPAPYPLGHGVLVALILKYYFFY